MEDGYLICILIDDCCARESVMPHYGLT